MSGAEDKRRVERKDAAGAFLAVKGARLALADLSTMGARTQAPLAGAADGDSLIATLIVPGADPGAAPSEHVVPALVIANGARGLVIRYSALDPAAETAIERFLARES